MRITARALSRSTLNRQLLLRRESLGVAHAVRRVVALQAQEAAWEGLAAEARSLPAFLAGRDPAVYRRYDRWWRTLCGAEVRLLCAG